MQQQEAAHEIEALHVAASLAVAHSRVRVALSSDCHVPVRALVGSIVISRVVRRTRELTGGRRRRLLSAVTRILFDRARRGRAVQESHCVEYARQTGLAARVAQPCVVREGARNIQRNLLHDSIL